MAQYNQSVFYWLYWEARSVLELCRKSLKISFVDVELHPSPHFLGESDTGDDTFGKLGGRHEVNDAPPNPISRTSGLIFDVGRGNISGLTRH